MRVQLYENGVLVETAALDVGDSLTVYDGAGRAPINVRLDREDSVALFVRTDGVKAALDRFFRRCAGLRA